MVKLNIVYIDADFTNFIYSPIFKTIYQNEFQEHSFDPQHWNIFAGL